LRNKKWLLRQAKQSNSAVHWDNYRSICKQIETATKRKYHEFLKDLQSNLKDNPKKFWSFYRSKTNSARLPKVVYFGTIKASTPAAKGNLFNHFFASMFLKTDLHKVETTTTFTVQDDKLYSIQATVEEVLKALKNSDPSKGCGPDPIQGRVLQECVGCIPQDWKRANIVPVFKKGGSKDVCSYRAISLLSLISKIAEHVFSRFSNFIADKIYPMQHGFVKGRSTVTQLLNMVHFMVRTIDHGEQTDVTFLNFSKAFDSVSHAHLIRKLD